MGNLRDFQLVVLIHLTCEGLHFALVLGSSYLAPQLGEFHSVHKE